jgi:hypothetical protein
VKMLSEGRGKEKCTAPEGADCLPANATRLARRN